MTFTGSFDVGPGWVDICRAAVERLEKFGVEIFQIKEKFGRLCIYWNAGESFCGGLKTCEKIVEEAQIVASWTCMQCGKVKSDVAVRSDKCDWLVGYCQECFDNWNKERREED